MMPMRTLRLALLSVLAAAVAFACGGSEPAPADTREPCARRDPDKQVFFGDLHVHTSYSFDAHAFEVRVSPDDAYDFARGAELALPPLDAAGQGTQRLRLERPLDFAAVTDHSEYLGEVEACTTPGSSEYDSAGCVSYRRGGNSAVIRFGLALGELTPRPDICGGTGCPPEHGRVWQRVIDAAERAYDRTAACGFTSFIAYEYSASPGVSTLHRNVIFRGRDVPAPATFFENPRPEDLWSALETACPADGKGCEVLAIPHNSNESNGNMFFVEYPGAQGLEAERAAARRRAAIEPLVEIYQHKSSSECMNEVSGILGGTDEQCDFEVHRRQPFVDCGDDRGGGGSSRTGCFSRLDFVRGALLAGLAEERRLGVNPYRLGILAGTDTHNGTPGAVAEEDFVGHRGTDDASPDDRLSTGGLTPGGVEFSPGGLVAVWSEENSREAIFDALRRREVYGTSGPRIALRFFAGWALPAGLCDDPQLVATASAAGVPMGGVLPAGPPGGRPRFVIAALKDAGTEARPGMALERLQLIKAWVDASGAWHQRVIDVAGGANEAAVDPATCRPTGTGGAAALCATFEDESFDPATHAVYYARVLENPSCRWSAHTCNALPPGQRPALCDDASVPRVVKERAWSSPIWVTPGAR
jgi:hypothetical protein